MSAGASSSSANLFRRLVWQSSVPISIRLGDGEPGFGSTCDRYYVSPQSSYPLHFWHIGRRKNDAYLVIWGRCAHRGIPISRC
jgi:hypothetical protein